MSRRVWAALSGAALIMLSALGVVASPAQAMTGWQPSPPFTATFLYGWYGNPSTDGAYLHWRDHGHADAPSSWFSHFLPDPQPQTFDPATELYSSGDYATFQWQMRELATARQQVGLYSWMGRGDHWTNDPVKVIDANFRRIITDYANRPDNPYPNFRWAISYDYEGYDDPSVAAIDADLAYVKANYAGQPGYLKVGGKPVVFVYNAAHPPGYPTWGGPVQDFTRWAQVRKDTGFYVVLKRDPLGQPGVDPAGVDAWYEYAPANRAGTTGSWSSFVSPGFWLDGESPRLARDPAAFTAAVRAMAARDVTWKLTETWNEWHEGTAVEPGTEVDAAFQPDGKGFGATYVNTLGCYLPQLSAGLGDNGANSFRVPATTCPAPTWLSIVGPSGDPVKAVTDANPGPVPVGFRALGQTATAAPPSTTADQPLHANVTVPTGLIPSGLPVTVSVNGVAAVACTDATGRAVPDPCVSSRSVAPDGTVTLGVLSSAGAHWAMVAPSAGSIAAACPDGQPATFSDISGDPHAPAITCLHSREVVSGTSATTYTPRRSVNREQMAGFLTRLLSGSGATLPAGSTDRFSDVPAGDVFRTAINQLADLGIVRGTTAGDYRPAEPVTRAQMAAMIARTQEHVMGSSLPAPTTTFTDIAGNTFATDIAKVAGVGIALGTTPETYQPATAVRRDQMASFLGRSLNLLVVAGKAP